MLLRIVSCPIRVNRSPKQAIKLATNNHAAILDDPNGAYCYHCLGKPTITQSTRSCDADSWQSCKDWIANFRKATVICPLCEIDSVVPASSVPGPINETLKQWHNYWFTSCRSVSIDLEPRHYKSRIALRCPPTNREIEEDETFCEEEEAEEETVKIPIVVEPFCLNMVDFPKLH